MPVVDLGREIAEWGRETGKGRQPVKCMLSSKLPPWDNGAESRWDLWDPGKKTHNRGIPHNGEEAGLPRHQLWPVIGWKLL